MRKSASILVLELAILHYAIAVCNVCNNNGVACINDKQFHPCFERIADISKTFSCLGENEICTTNGRVCMDRVLTSARRACGDTANCGKCEGENDGVYTCTSRTTFTMCLGGNLTDIRDTCRANKMCDIAVGKQGMNPCVPTCRMAQIEFCDLFEAIDVEVTTTTPTSTITIPTPTTTAELPKTSPGISSTATVLNTTSTQISSTLTTPIANITTTTTRTTTERPTTNSTTQMPAQFCSIQSTVGRYADLNDTTCKNYFYCFQRDGTMQGTAMTCPAALYFNPVGNTCISVKPVGCP